jgi:hypothetical protein
MHKTLLAAALLAVTTSLPANAGAVLQGTKLNGFSLNGFTLNGFTLNGINLNGFTLNGINLNGVRPDPVGVNVGGHAGVGLNGQVIAIEF